MTTKEQHDTIMLVLDEALARKIVSVQQYDRARDALRDIFNDRFKFYNLWSNLAKLTEGKL